MGITCTYKKSVDKIGRHRRPILLLLTHMRRLSFITLILFLTVLGFTRVVYSQQQVEMMAKPITLKAALFFSPANETILAGSTFDVSVILDTLDNSVNTIELNIKFPVDKLEIVKPVKDKSLFSIWLEPPVYSNIEGIARFVGVITNGITTQNGVVTTITFRSKATGSAIVNISKASKVLANDGLGTEMAVDFGRGVFIVNPRPPEGPKVFSETHQFEDRWYNNNSPIISWEGVGASDFSFILDNKPFTIPDDVSDTKETTKAYESLGDGLRYFHIKAKKEGVWGKTTYFLLRIDTTPPANFNPRLEILNAAVISRSIVSFFTTDALSGIDHYEVGVIDKKNSPTEAPVFTQAESPYQIPSLISGDLRIIVRAFDKAGNVKDASVDTKVPFFLFRIGEGVKGLSFFLIVIVMAVYLLIHYLYGHKIIAQVRRIIYLLKTKDKTEEDEHDWHE